LQPLNNWASCASNAGIAGWPGVIVFNIAVATKVPKIAQLATLLKLTRNGGVCDAILIRLSKTARADRFPRPIPILPKLAVHGARTSAFGNPPSPRVPSEDDLRKSPRRELTP
jgi:hypothetical protein